MKTLLILCVLFAIGCVDQEQAPSLDAGAAPQQDAEIQHIDATPFPDAAPFDYQSWGGSCDPTAPICTNEVNGLQGWCVQYKSQNVCEPACAFTCPDNGKKNYTQDGLCFCTAN